MAKQRYEFVEGSSKKFWEVQVSGSKLTVTFGRIGTAGRATTKDLGSPAAAKKEADKLIKQKTKKGYRLAAGGKKAAPKKAAPKKAAPKKAAPKKAAPKKAAASPLTDILADMSDVLGKLYPDSYAERAEPADTKLWGELERAVPVPLRELYGWMDGCHEFLYGPDDEGVDWLDLAHGLDERRMLLSLAAEGRTTFEDNLLPLFGDGSGDFYCADLDSGDDELILWRFFHEEPKTRKPRAKLTYLLKLTLSAMKKGTWRNGFEGEAGAERRAKTRKKFEAMMTKLDAGKPDFDRVSSTISALEQDGCIEEAFLLAEKADRAGKAPSNQWQYTAAFARTRALPLLLKKQDFEALLRVSSAISKVDTYAGLFEVWHHRFDALRGLGRADSPEAKTAVTRARTAALRTRKSIEERSRSFRLSRDEYLEAAAQELHVARMSLAIADPQQARQALGNARAVPGMAGWVDEQLANDHELAKLT